jgi:uncharacterized repeat protein (TIGR03833 family)
LKIILKKADYELNTTLGYTVDKEIINEQIWGCVRIMNGQNRKDIKPGLAVRIVLKQDQRTGKLTDGIVKDILTNSVTHPHGIKVRLTDGQVGRVQEIKSSHP